MNGRRETVDLMKCVLTVRSALAGIVQNTSLTAPDGDLSRPHAVCWPLQSPSVPHTEKSACGLHHLLAFVRKSVRNYNSPSFSSSETYAKRQRVLRKTTSAIGTNKVYPNIHARISLKPSRSAARVNFSAVS